MSLFHFFLQSDRKQWILHAEELEATGQMAAAFEMAPIQSQAGQEPLAASARTSAIAAKPQV